MTKDEAMQKALFCLEIYGAQSPAVLETIEALRTALAQSEPEIEPVAVVASLKINAQKSLLARGFMLTSPLYTDPR